ncbi:MAG TPA: ABC transporter substrate-binding protein [Jiangellaceae bacterium]
MRARKLHVGAVLAAVAALTLAACGGDDDDGDAGEGAAGDSDTPVVVGTTDTVTNIDPAGEFDRPSNNIVDSLYEKLLTIPPGGTEPEPQLAESCEWADDVTYTCTLKEGLQFSDGSDLTAEDVVHSFQRQLTIQHESGGWTLMGGINPDNGGSVEATDDLTVVFNLAAPDATFPMVLSAPNMGSIVPSDTYPMDALQPNDQVIGSGPYVIGEFDPSTQITLEPNESYAGDREVNNGGVIIQKFDQASALKQAIEAGDVNIAYSGLGVTDTADLVENGAERGVEVLEGEGTEINYMVMQTGRPPLDNPAVRQAIAQIIDRETIAESIYEGTVTPLYGPIPEGLDGHKPSFQEVYGEPDPEAAAQILADAGVETPVAFTLWWMPDRYGEEIADMYAEIERQLEADGLFDVTLESESWESYSTTFSDGSKDAFDLGWFPDFPDASNYITGFYASDDRNFLNAGYSNPEMDQIIDEVLVNPNQEERIPLFEQAADIVAQDVPIVQLWQRNQFAYIREGVEGVSDTLDTTFIFRYYMVSAPSE